MRYHLVGTDPDPGTLQDNVDDNGQNVEESNAAEIEAITTFYDLEEHIIEKKWNGKKG